MIKQRVDYQLAQQGYTSFKALRLSYEVNEANQVSYQGITKAEYEGTPYIIKWQLKLENKSDSSSLDTEIANIKRLQQSYRVQCQNSRPELIQYQFIKTSIMDVHGEQWQLTGLAMPYFPSGSLSIICAVPINQATKATIGACLSKVCASNTSSRLGAWGY